MERKLYRLKNDRKICGVCSGFARYIGIDPTIMRLLWIISVCITSGFPCILYLACIFIIPEEPDPYFM